MLRLLIQEIAFRKANFLLGLAAVAVAAGLFVVGPALLDGYGRETRAQLDAMQSASSEQLRRLEDETRKIMLKQGFNLRIVHRDTDMASLHMDFRAVDMPQEYVERLAKSPHLTKIAHIVATLYQPITWEGRKRLLIGYAPEAVQPNAGEKQPMGFNIQQGTVLLGHETGIGHQPGETIEVLGRQFRIADILKPRDNVHDLMIAMHLSDAQTLVDKPGKITEILAINCRCQTVDRLGEIRAQLAEILPDVKVTEAGSIAVARAEQRDLAKQHHQQQLAQLRESRRQMEELLAAVAGVATPLVVLACAAWVGLLAWTNVRQRRAEIGIWRALGKTTSRIVGLLLGKAALLGVLGGLLGCAVGVPLANRLASSRLGITAENLPPLAEPVAWTLVAAPLVAVLASYLPTLIAILQDPATVLREE